MPTDIQEQPPRKITRSSTVVRLSTAKSTLQPVCVICEKKVRYYSHRSRTKKAIIQIAKTETAGNIQTHSPCRTNNSNCHMSSMIFNTKIYFCCLYSDFKLALKICDDYLSWCISHPNPIIMPEVIVTRSMFTQGDWKVLLPVKRT